MALDRLTIPASYTINGVQPDKRQIKITINLMFEGACFGKCLFSFNSINAAIPDMGNIPILAEDGSYGVGVIPESIEGRWTMLLIDGKWRNYLQSDALLWSKMKDKLPDFLTVDKEFHCLEVNLADIDAELQENGLYAVSAFQVVSCRLTSQQVTDYTAYISRYGNLPKR